MGEDNFAGDTKQLNKNFSQKWLARLFRYLCLVILFIANSVMLDLIARNFQLFPGIVAWYPADGVSLAFLISLGLSFTPWVAVTSLLSSLLVYQLNADFVPIVMWALVLSAALGTLGAFLKRKVARDPKLADIRTGFWLMVSSGGLALILAVISVTNLVQFGAVPRESYTSAILQWWIGEMIGILAFTPFLLIYIMPLVHIFLKGQQFTFKKVQLSKPSPELVGQIVGMLAALYLIFGIPLIRQFHPFFIIAFPLIWVALKNGFARTTIAIALSNAGVVLSIWIFKFDLAMLSELQFLLFGIYICVLIIGAVVTKQKKADEGLRQNEILNRALIENAPDGFVLLTEDLRIKYRSPSTERLLGYKPDENLRINVALLTHPDDANWVQNVFNDVVRSPGKVTTAEYRVKHQDDSWHWIESTFTNQLENPSLEAVVVNFRDISERKMTEEALRQSEKRFRALIENSQEQISLLDANGILVYESPNLYRPLGYPPGSFVGGQLLDLFHPGERDEVIQLIDTVRQTPGMVKKALFRARHYDGSWRWLEGYISNLLEEPAVKSIVINYFDVSERIEKEKEIEVLAKIPAESPNPVLRMSKEGVILYANEASEPIMKIWECQVDEKVPQYMIDIGEVAFSRKENISVEITCDDQIFGVNVTPIVETGYINLYGRDITKRVRAEESLKVSNEELSMLFQLSHSLAEAENLGHIFDIVNRHTVESMHNAFARIALLENEHFVMKAGFPSRAINNDFRLGESIPVSSLPVSKRIMHQNEPAKISINDPEISETERNVLFIGGARSLCLVPLRTSDYASDSETLVGLLLLGDTEFDDTKLFTPEKMQLVHTIADSAAIAIRRMVLRDQTERRMNQLIALSKIDLAIISNTDIQYRLEVVCRQIMDQLAVDAVDFWTFDPVKEQLFYSFSRGFISPIFNNPRPVNMNEGVIGQVVMKRQMIHLSNILIQNKTPRLAEALAEEPFMGYYAVPLIANNEVKGVLEVFHRAALEGNPEWLNFLQILANQAAIAIDNSSLFNDLRQSNSELIQAYDATIQGWSRALDLRDNETEGHTQRVTELTLKLARMFGLPEEELVHIRRGALLHDIGKMGVPDRILLKPGPLTDEEWIIMRQHTSYAFELLSPITFLENALDIPLYHHEKWDGTGYPYGLSGEQIPFSARLFSVVDVWDALTSNRPYRDAWPEEKVLDYIRSLSGIQFDPQVVKVCLEPGLLTGQLRKEPIFDQLKWSEQYSVGVRDLDLQHQKLIGIINRLVSVTNTKYIHTEIIGMIWDELNQYIQTHFSAEERLMSTYGYEAMEHHLQMHRDFEKKTTEFYEKFNQRANQTADDLLAYLIRWWNQHILVEDMSYKEFFKEKGLF